MVLIEYNIDIRVQSPIQYYFLTEITMKEQYAETKKTLINNII